MKGGRKTKDLRRVCDPNRLRIELGHQNQKKKYMGTLRVLKEHSRVAKRNKVHSESGDQLKIAESVKTINHLGTTRGRRRTWQATTKMLCIKGKTGTTWIGNEEKGPHPLT